MITGGLTIYYDMEEITEVLKKKRLLDRDQPGRHTTLPPLRIINCGRSVLRAFPPAFRERHSPTKHHAARLACYIPPPIPLCIKF